jgi:hypothetical protein
MEPDLITCALCGRPTLAVDDNTLRQRVPWEGRSVAHRGCAGDVIRERARDADSFEEHRAAVAEAAERDRLDDLDHEEAIAQAMAENER